MILVDLAIDCTLSKLDHLSGSFGPDACLARPKLAGDCASQLSSEAWLNWWSVAPDVNPRGELSHRDYKSQCKQKGCFPTPSSSRSDEERD